MVFTAFRQGSDRLGQVGCGTHKWCSAQRVRHVLEKAVSVVQKLELEVRQWGLWSRKVGNCSKRGC